MTAAAVATIREKCPELLQLTALADVFPPGRGGGAEGMATAFGVPFLGRVPLEPSITRACEAGTSYTSTARAAGGRSLLQPVVEKLRASEP